MSWFRDAWAYVATVEVLTLLAFVLASWFQSYSGQIVLDETPMEFMHLNAVHQAHHFPPRDAWLSGHDVVYYYFGYVIVSAVARIASIPTEIAFNLGFGMFVAVTVASALGIAFNLLSLRVSPTGSDGRIRMPRITIHSPAFAGAVGAAALFILLGNLVGALLFASACVGGDAFYDRLDSRIDLR